MIPVSDISAVPVERALAAAGFRCTPSLGALALPSPRATKKQRRTDPIALKIDRRTGAWTDHHTGRSGHDVAGLLAYAVRTTREAALHRLAAALQPGDTALDRCIRPGDTGRARVEENSTETSTLTDARLAKFARTGTPRQRALALLQSGMNSAARYRRGRAD